METSNETSIMILIFFKIKYYNQVSCCYSNETGLLFMPMVIKTFEEMKNWHSFISQVWLYQPYFTWFMDGLIIWDIIQTHCFNLETRLRN